MWVLGTETLSSGRAVGPLVAKSYFQATMDGFQQDSLNLCSVGIIVAALSLVFILCVCTNIYIYMYIFPFLKITMLTLIKAITVKY